jgi:hypothetical protein
MSIEFGDEVNTLMTGLLNFPRHTRSFDSREAIAQIYPNHLEVHRFMRRPKADRAS